MHRVANSGEGVEGDHQEHDPLVSSVSGCVDRWVKRLGQVLGQLNEFLGAQLLVVERGKIRVALSPGSFPDLLANPLGSLKQLDV